jgi:hypothetical protein
MGGREADCGKPEQEKENDMTEQSKEEQAARERITRIVNVAAHEGASVSALYEAKSIMTDLQDSDPASFERFRDEAADQLATVGIGGTVPGTEMKFTLKL